VSRVAAGAASERLSDGREVRTFQLRRGDLSVDVMDYGGIIRALRVPDASGSAASVVLALNSVEDYERSSPYFGAIIGRYANRIANGRFELEGRVVNLPANDAGGSLHGGERGFDRQVWEVRDASDSHLVLRYVSPDGDQGYPGEVEALVTYRLVGSRTLRIEYEATTNAPTPISMTNHSYFNLGGEGSGTALGHHAHIDADSFLPVGADLIPTGEVRSVVGTEMDFRRLHPMEEGIRVASVQVLISRGYDHSYVLNRTRTEASGLAFAGRFEDPSSGRAMEVWTTEPVADFYTGNFLDGSLAGPSDRTYRQGDAFAFEPERPSNGPNTPDWRSVTLFPGERYRSATEYRFSLIE
jgi:aldose 1-epimerase